MSFEAVLIRADRSQESPVTGAAETILAYVAAIDWPSLSPESSDISADMPALEVRREANGDLLVMEYDCERDMFQCHAIVEVPKKVLGLTSYLWNESWESEAVWLDKSDSATALRAFCDARIEDLRAMWERA